MWGRDKNFQVSMIFEVLNDENKILLLRLFIVHPLGLTLYGMELGKMGIGFSKIHIGKLFVGTNGQTSFVCADKLNR